MTKTRQSNLAITATNLLKIIMTGVDMTKTRQSNLPITATDSSHDNFEQVRGSDSQI